MKTCTGRVAFAAVAVLFFTIHASSQKAVPNPFIYFLGQEPYTANGVKWVRYRYAVSNYDAYPDAMFAASPDLPPCGRNSNSARTWVDLFDQRGKRLYGFCALRDSASLNTIWFALPENELPPSYIYIELNDRQANIKYKSNLADTTL